MPDVGRNPMTDTVTLHALCAQNVDARVAVCA